MTITVFQDLTPDACIQTMETFWREQVEAAYTRDGIALTLPLMYPDGWQMSWVVEWASETPHSTS